MTGGLKNIDNVTVGKTAAKPEPQPDPTPAAPAPETNRVLVAWSGDSFDYAEKGFIWYAIATAIILTIIGYFVWQRDWFSIAITVVVSAVLFWYAATARPKAVNYALTTFGIQVDSKFYPFSEIHSYWMIYSDRVKKINLILNKKYLPTLTIDISGAQAEKVRAVLSRKLPEQEGRTENVLDRLLRMIRL